MAARGTWSRATSAALTAALVLGLLVLATPAQASPVQASPVQASPAPATAPAPAPAPVAGGLTAADLPRVKLPRVELPQETTVRRDISPRLFDCTQQKDRRKKLNWWEVFVDRSLPPIEIELSNATGSGEFHEDSGYLYLAFGIDVTFTIKAQLKLGVHCELSRQAVKDLKLFDKKIGQIGPVPIRLAARPVIELDSYGKGGITVSHVRRFDARFEVRDGAVTESSVTFDPVRTDFDMSLGFEASAGAGFEIEVYAGHGQGANKVGAGVALKVMAKLTGKAERGCGELYLAVPVSIALNLHLWVVDWKLAELSHDFARTNLATVCFSRPTIVNDLPPATQGISYDERLRTEDNRSGRWAVEPGTMPPGLVLDPDSGRLYGVPAGPLGSHTLTVTFTDIAQQRKTSSVALQVLPTPPTTGSLLGNIARLDDGTAWYVDRRGGRHPIPDGGTYECLVAQGARPVAVTPDQVKDLPLYERAACVRAGIGDVIRTKDGDAYLLADGWVRRWIPDGNTYDCLRLNGHAIVNGVPRYYVMDHASGPDITFDCADPAAGPGHVIRADDGSSWYVDLRGTSHWIPDGGTYECITQQGRPVHPYVVPRRLLANFGTPKENAACVRAGPGDIIRSKDGDSYLVNADWTRSWIPDGRTYQCLEVNDHRVVDNVPRYWLMDLRQVADVSFSCYDPAGVRGKVVRLSDGSSFYVDKRDGRHWVPDGGTYECIAAQAGAWPHRVPAAWLTQTKYEDAACVRARPGDIVRHSDGDAYVVNADWTRGWIPDAPSYACFRAEGRTVVDRVPRYWLMDLRQVGNAAYPSGHCIVRRPGGAAYYVNNEGKKEWVPDTPTWDCEVGRGVPVVNSTDALVDSITEVGWHYCLNKANLRGKILRHADGDAHVIHGDDTRTWIPDEFTYGCRTRAGLRVVDTRWREYVNAFPDKGWDYCFDINTFKGRYIRHPDGDIHFVDDRGVRHWVPNSSVEGCLNGRHGAPATVRWREYIERIPQGDWAVCGDTLRRNQNFDQGQWLRSSNGAYTLVMQSDANLVLYHGSRAIWASGTNGRPVHHLKLHDNGCLALIDSRGNWLWRPSPDPCNKGGDRLVVQSDGNLVLYAGSRAVWASNTAGR